MLQNAFKVKLTIVGEDFGEFDAFSGGAWDHDEQKYIPFDGIQRTYLTSETVSNLTLTRSYEEARDGAVVKRKKDLMKKACQATVLDQDVDGHYQQNREPYPGLIKGMTAPDGDSNSNNVAFLVIEISTGKAGG